MTVLFSNNFDADADNSAGGLVIGLGEGFVVKTASSITRPTISGLKVQAAAGDGIVSLYTASGLLGNQAIRYATKIAALTTAGYAGVGPILRANANASESYRLILETDNIALRATIGRNQSGFTALASTAYAFTPSPTDVVHIECSAVGTTITLRAWLNSGAAPTAPVASATQLYVTVVDGIHVTGYPGIRMNGAFAWAIADDLVVTNGAGGEDFFNAPVATPIALAAAALCISTSSGSLTTGIRLSSSAVGFATATAALASSGLSSIAISTATASANLSTAIKLLASGISTATASAALTAPTTFGFTTPDLKNNAGVVLANEVGIVVNVYNSTTGALVVRKTGLTSDASGFVVVRDVALASGTTYSYEVVLTTLGRRLPTAAAS